MRVVIMGASSIAIESAKNFIKEDYEVIIIESNEEIIETLSEELDCSFINGDGTKPNILKEADPKSADILLCLTNHDQDNIIAALVGKSVGFKKVVVNVTDDEWRSICLELGLKDTIISAHIISQHLKEQIKGKKVFDLANFVKNELGIFSFKATKKEVGDIGKLNLPNDSKVVWSYRDEKVFFANNDTKIKEGDEVVIATYEKNIDELLKRFTYES